MNPDEVGYESEEFNIWYDRGIKGLPPPADSELTATSKEAWLIGESEQEWIANDHS